MVTEPGLPGPGYAISRIRPSAATAVIGFPVLIFFSYGRLLRSGLPLSRLINPGAITLLLLTVFLLAIVCLPRVGRPTVVAGDGWVANRGLFARQWRVVTLQQADRWCQRLVRARSGMKSVVTVAGQGNRPVSFSFPAGDPGLAELIAALRAAGATEVDRKALRSVGRWPAALIVVYLVALVAVPMIYLEIGPLRLLPRPLAEAFTWSGCRATLAAEGDQPTSSMSYLINPTVAHGTVWRFDGERQLDAPEYVRHTEDPAARLAHLQRNGFLVAYESYLQDPAGTVVAFEMLRFATPAGALSYDHYVNRAVCEHEFGAHGPLPTEVRLHHGQGALVRWVSASTIIEVGQTDSHPFASRAQVEAIAAALGAKSNEAR